MNEGGRGERTEGERERTEEGERERERRRERKGRSIAGEGGFGRGREEGEVGTMMLVWWFEWFMKVLGRSFSR